MKHCLPNPLPSWFSKVNAGDKFLRIVLTEGGKKAYVLNDTMAIFRKHESGNWSALGFIKRYPKQRNDLEILLHAYGSRFMNYKRYLIDVFNFNAIYYYIVENNYPKAVNSLVNIMRYPLYILQNHLEFIKRVIATIFPFLLCYYHDHLYKKGCDH